MKLGLFHVYMQPLAIRCNAAKAGLQPLGVDASSPSRYRVNDWRLTRQRQGVATATCRGCSIDIVKFTPWTANCTRLMSGNHYLASTMQVYSLPVGISDVGCRIAHTTSTDIKPIGIIRFRVL